MGIVVAITTLTRGEVAKTEIPVLQVKVGVVMWAAVGSLGAILYRFYKQQHRVHFDVELRWLIARPIVGIIMGAVSCLAIEAGLLLVTGGNATPSPGTDVRPEVFWIVAFLAGFSDRFYERVISLLVDKTVGEDSPNEPKKAAGDRPGDKNAENPAKSPDARPEPNDAGQGSRNRAGGLTQV